MAASSREPVRVESGRILTEKSPLVKNLSIESTHNSKMDKFDSLCVLEPQSAAKLSSKVEAAKSRHYHYAHSVPASRWCVNALIGFVCGIVSFFLKECIAFLFSMRASLILSAAEGGGAWIATAWFHAWGFAALCLIVSASTIIFFEPHAAGSGIPETCAFLNGVIIPKTFSLRVVLAKFTSCVLAVGSGIPAGPEGPMIHMGSILGSLVSQGQLFIGPHLEPLKAKIAHFRNISDRRDFMAAGVAGGVAAAFGAPIGGLLFVAEEIASHFDMDLGMQIFLCSACACITVELLTSAFEGFEYTGGFGMIKEDSAILFDVNKQISVNVLMFPPTILLGVLGGLLGALFNTLCLAATDFRGKYIKKYQTLFLLEPIGLAAVYITATIFIPTLFACQRSDCDGDPRSGEGCERVGMALVSDGMAYGCPASGGQDGASYYNPSATLMINSGEHVVKQLFARGFHYQFDYLPLLAMLFVYLPLSAYTNGIACSTGIVVPCLLNGALIGRIFGLLMTDMNGGVSDDETRQWIDPGAFALLGAASFFGGVARITMALTVIITEISNDTHFILPIMAAIMVAKWTGDATGVHPIYHALMAKKNLPYMGTSPHTHLPLDIFVAGQVATADVKTVQLKTSIPEIAALLLSCKHNAFPAVEPTAHWAVFLGLVRREHLVAICKSPKLWKNTEALAVPPQFQGKFTDEQVCAFQDLFAFYDKDGSGDIDRAELAHILESLGEVVTQSKLDAMVSEVDQDGDGELSWTEFLHVMTLSKTGLFKDVVEKALKALSADELSTQELKAFDAPEDLSSAELDRELQKLANPTTHGKYAVDLKPYVDRSAFSVPATFSLQTTYSLFRSMGLRHIVVVDAFNYVQGIITRHNLLEQNLQALLKPSNIRTPDEILEHHLGA